MAPRHIARERRAVFGGFSLPTFVLDLLLASLDASVEQRAGFKPLATLSPLAHAPHCDAPALFVRARRDPLISQEHVEILAKRYKGPRTLALVEGTHSSPRDVDARRFIAREAPGARPARARALFFMLRAADRAKREEPLKSQAFWRGTSLCRPWRAARHRRPRSATSSARPGAASGTNSKLPPRRPRRRRSAAPRACRLPSRRRRRPS